MLPACNPGCWMAPGLGQLANEIDLLLGSYFEGHPDYKPRGLRSDARIRTGRPRDSRRAHGLARDGLAHLLTVDYLLLKDFAFCMRPISHMVEMYASAQK
ncbi:BQ5605_C029g10617 [Microbotryum silenes-dioicae]|uniref:BQ5605_C029g10617 protein n=1 Tax=Microbotryum silenes-dioicae TaxID=796604 RepID=A0A2X0NBS1_9BASI|nr:BQ5605_C029g10617 [Microbotryum silenes-dioicae]